MLVCLTGETSASASPLLMVLVRVSAPVRRRRVARSRTLRDIVSFAFINRIAPVPSAGPDLLADKVPHSKVTLELPFGSPASEFGPNGTTFKKTREMFAVSSAVPERSPVR